MERGTEVHAVPPATGTRSGFWVERVCGVFLHAYPVAFRGNPGVDRGIVDFNGVDYEAKVAHTSVAGQTPPTRPDLWNRVNNMNGDWAVQTPYAVGDRVFFNAHVYRALVAHQATSANSPPNPAFWELVL